MARAPTVLTTEEDKASFGYFLRWAINVRGKDQSWLQREFHRGATTKYERRPSDIDDYLSGQKIPDFENLEHIRSILNVPRGAMLTAAGYIDTVLSCLTTTAAENEIQDWIWPQSPRAAALERLFSLFPSGEMDPAIDHNSSFFWILQKMGRSSIMSDDPMQRLWPFWVWMKPKVIQRQHLIHREQHRIDPLIGDQHQDTAGNDDKEIYRAIRVEYPVSLADQTTNEIFNRTDTGSLKETDGPMYRALEILRDDGQRWPDRTKIAAHYVHQWANELYRDAADDIRRRMQAAQEHEITEAEEAQLLGWLRLAESEAKPRESRRSTQFE